MLIFSFLSPWATDSPISKVLFVSIISVVSAYFFTLKTKNLQTFSKLFLSRLSEGYTALAYQTWPLHEERGLAARPAEEGETGQILHNHNKLSSKDLSRKQASIAHTFLVSASFASIKILWWCFKNGKLEDALQDAVEITSSFKSLVVDM